MIRRVRGACLGSGTWLGTCRGEGGGNWVVVGRVLMLVVAVRHRHRPRLTWNEFKSHDVGIVHTSESCACLQQVVLLRVIIVLSSQIKYNLFRCYISRVLIPSYSVSESLS